MTLDMSRDLAELPKAHLHLHLEAGVRISTLADLATRQGVPTPQMTVFASFTEFDRLYKSAVHLFETAEDMERLVLEIAEDAAAFGCRWVEPAVWPPLHSDRLGSSDEVLSLLTAAAERATEATGVGIGYLVAADRTLPAADAEELAVVAARWAGRGVVSFGLHNDERFAPAAFARAFAIAREAGLLATPHAGELAGPESVRDSLDLLGADRIQHGIRAIEDPELVARLAETGTVLDVCPTSNRVLQVVPNLADHPLPRLLAAGVACSLNGDDPVMFDCDLGSEYRLAREVLGLDDAQLAQVARASLAGSGAPAEVKAAALVAIDAWLDH